MLLVASVLPGETTTSLSFTASVIVRSWRSWFPLSCLLACSSEGKARSGDGRAVSKEAATARVEKDPFEDAAEARWEFGDAATLVTNAPPMRPRQRRKVPGRAESPFRSSSSASRPCGRWCHWSTPIAASAEVRDSAVEGLARPARLTGRTHRQLWVVGGSVGEGGRPDGAPSSGTIFAICVADTARGDVPY